MQYNWIEFKTNRQKKCHPSGFQAPLLETPSNRAQEGAAQFNAAQETMTRKPGDPGKDRGWHGGGWFSLGRGGGGSKQKLALGLGGLGQGLKENRVIPSAPGGDGGRRRQVTGHWQVGTLAQTSGQ